MTVPPMLATYLDAMFRRRGTDLYLSGHNRPAVRVDGRLVPIAEAPPPPAVLTTLLQDLLGDARYARFEAERQLDFSFSYGDRGRIRANAFFAQGLPALACRLIPTVIPTMAELDLPLGARRLAEAPRGLVLVTGPTGSGKSTTLAAMIRHLNETQPVHIVSIEDPVEYLHTPMQACIEQREVGQDTPSFAQGLRAALRQNPDVVLIGEMRDLETIHIAVTLAETGHLVLATLHTPDAPGAIDRIVDVFPAGQQQQVRIQLAASLMGVVAQLLLPRIGGGRVACFEVMLATPAVRGQIREGKTAHLRTTITTSVGDGMQTMEMSLADRVRRGLVRLEDARAVTIHPDELEALLRQGTPAATLALGRR